MNTPEWTEEGAPVNIEATLADALEWLLWLERSGIVQRGHRGPLDSCIAAARRYVPKEFERGPASHK